MVILLGASSLNYLIKDRSKEISIGFKRAIRQHTIPVSGLTFHPKCHPNQRAEQYIKLSKEKLIIWHDSINNSDWRHPRKPSQKSYTVQFLVADLIRLKNNIVAIVYLQRKLAPNVLTALQSTKILVIQVTKHLLTQPTRRNREFVENLTNTHPAVTIEYTLSFLILRWLHNLQSLIQKNRPNNQQTQQGVTRQNKKSKKSRLRKKKRLSLSLSSLGEFSLLFP